VFGRKFQISLLAFLLAGGYLFLNGCEYFLPKDWKTYKLEEVFANQPWAYVIPQVSAVRGINGIKASDCGNCHTEIYNEWKSSTHSQALHDLQFQAELSKPATPVWLCLNCHIPVQNQREYIVIGLEDGNFRKPLTIPNPGFDLEMREEGVTCATCHIHTTDSGEFLILGANGNLNPPHPVLRDPVRLRNRCNDCHNAEYVLDQDLICYFQTGDEMKASKHISEQEKSCSSCHLPRVERSIVKAELKRPVRISHKHTFWGGGVPKNFQLYKTLLDSGYYPALQLKDFQFTKAAITLKLKNANPAHKLPSGDPERHILILLEIFNRNKELLQTKSVRIGQEWEWWPEAKLLNDNRLAPMEEREITLPIQEIADLVGRIKISAYHIRLTEENAKYMKENSFQANPRYRDKIQNLDQYYPYRTRIHLSEWNYEKGWIREKSWKKTIQEWIKEQNPTGL